MRLSQPVGIAADHTGNLYVSQARSLSILVPGIGAGTSAVLRISPSGVVTTLAGGSYSYFDGTGSTPLFVSPAGVAVDASGNVYAADSGDDTILRITPGGAVSIFAGSTSLGGSSDGTGAEARFSSPNGLAADASGNVYVADSGNNTIRRITPGGAVSTLAGTPGVTGSADGAGAAAQFNAPSGVAVDGAGNVYVADSGNATIRVITPGGAATTLAGTPGATGNADGTGHSAQFQKPTAMAVDGAGNVYVADLRAIRKVTPGGNVSTLTRSLGPNQDYGGGIAVANGGDVYVTDGEGGEIWSISPSGTVSPFVGVANGAGAADGTGAAARFNEPFGVAVDGAGNVYVADSGNATVRKIAPGGTVSTLAGMAGSSGSADGMGSAARFLFPDGVAADGGGTVYIADSGNQTIRRIAPGGAVTTLAGTPGLPIVTANGVLPGAIVGGGDGTGAAARFGSPVALAVDGAGNVYVADSGYDTVRKITPGGVVTTLAGNPGVAGNADGTGSGALFDSPSGVALDGSGNVYVADSGNNAVRRITQEGVVTTLARSPGGAGAAAQFHGASSVAVDGDGDVFVVDSGDNLAWRITPSGVVATLAGTTSIPPGPGGADGIGAAAQFDSPRGVAVDGSGNVYVADTMNNTIRVGAPGRPPSIPTEPSFASRPESQTLASGGAVVFSASSGTLPSPGYQWSFDGVAIPGATDPTLLVTDVTAANSGEYFCVAKNSLGTSTVSATLAVVGAEDPGRLVNLSCRSLVGTGASVLIAGFVVGGGGTSGSESLLVRASGPALAPFGVAGYLPDPDLTLMNSGSGSVIAANSGWGGSALVTSTDAAVGAFPWVDASSLDSALPIALPAGSYTAQVAGASGDTGVALAEVYDATPGGSYAPSTPRLVNISARTQVGQGANVLIAGFVVGGTTSETVLIRASGPALVPFGILGALPDPQLQLYSTSGAIAGNAGWGGGTQIAAAAASVGAFSWGASATPDSAILVTLPPGAYTAQVSGVSGDSGIALVEIYEVR